MSFKAPLSLIVVLLSCASVSALEVVLSQPSAYEGDVINHDGSPLKIEGDIFDAPRSRKSPSTANPPAWAPAI